MGRGKRRVASRRNGKSSSGRDQGSSSSREIARLEGKLSDLRRKHSKTYAPTAKVMGQPGGVGSHIPVVPAQMAAEVSVVTYAAVYRMAMALAGTKHRVVRRNTDVEAKGPVADRIRRLMDRVNPEDTEMTLKLKAIVNWNLSGEMFLEKYRNAMGQVIELHHLNPANVNPNPDPTGQRRIASYTVRAGAGQIVIPATDVIPCLNFNPRNMYRGFSPITPIRSELTSDVAAAEYNRNILKNGIRTGGILSPKDGSFTDSDQLKQMQANLDAENVGSGNAGRMLVLPEGFDFHQDTMSVRDMDFVALRKWNRELITAAFGVAPMMIQNFDAATYANSEQQLKAFWDYSGKPLLKLIYGSLNEYWIHPDEDEDLSIVPDIVGIDAMIDSENSRVDNTTKLFQAGVITQNEARRRMNEEAVAGGDMFLMPMNLVPGESVAEMRDHQDRKLEPSTADVGNEDPQDGSNGQEGQETPTPPTKSLKDIVSPGDRKVLDAAYLKQLGEQEDKFSQGVGSFLKDQQLRLLGQLSDLASLPRLEEFFSVEQEAQKAFRDLAPIMHKILMDAGETALLRLGREKRSGLWHKAHDDSQREDSLVGVDFDLGNPELVEYLEVHFFKHLTDLNRVTMQRLQFEFDDALSKGEGVSEVFSRLQKMPEFSDTRAERIARTETGGAVNLSTHEAFKANGTPFKSWVSTGDANVRTSHKLIDEQTRDNPIPIDEPYILEDPERGVAVMKFPQDPSGPAWAVVQCLCYEDPREGKELHAYIERVKSELKGVEV